MYIIYILENKIQYNTIKDSIIVTEIGHTMYQDIFITGYKKWRKDPVQARKTIETSAKKALENHDLDFALQALQSIEVLTEEE